MIIRETREQDLKELPWLYRQYYNGDTGVETNYDNMLNKFKALQSNDNYIFLSAIDNEKLVGFCSLVINQDIVEQQKPIVMIWNMRVAPEFRNQGIGSCLLKHAEKGAKKINADFICLSCDLENVNAQRFYNKNNYKNDVFYYKYL